MQPTQPSDRACGRDGEGQNRLAVTVGAADAPASPWPRRHLPGPDWAWHNGPAERGREPLTELGGCSGAECAARPSCSRAPGAPSPSVRGISGEATAQWLSTCFAVYIPPFLPKEAQGSTSFNLWHHHFKGADCGTVYPAMMPGQIPDPSLTAGALPGLGPLTGLPGTTLTAEELKYADIRNIGAMISPLHFLEVKLGKRPQPVKSELDEEEERRKRRREKNKVAAARCRNKKKERTEFLQRESERLELMNAELKAQIEELKQERQQLILMLNRHRPTCIVRTDSVKTPESEANPLLEQLEKK
ncbi:jun dimerization protein 2 isoform X1 [Rhineura floridana]|nr:jun dimerization protein 2 isoform X1 [Rhineura floridana]